MPSFLHKPQHHVHSLSRTPSKISPKHHDPPRQNNLHPRHIPSLRSTSLQTQPCGIDLTLRRILFWTGAGQINFDNTQRLTAPTSELPFIHDKVTLKPGSYLVEFKESVKVPLDVVGQIFVRSSLFRSGASIHAGVMDSGYSGVVGALLSVVNPHGLVLCRDARLAQFVVGEMKEKVVGYSGVYQGRKNV
ncbi:hypothetical protein RUND412_007729 [Rhizina undulata]